MIRIRMRDFERLVREAFEELPAPIRARVQNLEIEVKSRPTPEELEEAGVEDPADLFGFYRGIPLPARGAYYDMTLPDLITIYRYAHELACDSLEELREEVRRTLRHELAHHFGIDDDRLEELGAY